MAATILSGEPMLDPVTGILFVLGFALACTRIRQPTYSLFLMLFAFNLLGGILSVDFEAPQSNAGFWVNFCRPVFRRARSRNTLAQGWINPVCLCPLDD